MTRIILFVADHPLVSLALIVLWVGLWETPH